jgi:hypothetical protein
MIEVDEQEGAEHTPLWGPRVEDQRVSRISVAEVLLPTFTAWGRLVRKVVMILEGTIVLKAEL